MSCPRPPVTPVLPHPVTTLYLRPSFHVTSLQIFTTAIIASSRNTLPLFSVTSAFQCFGANLSLLSLQTLLPGPHGLSLTGLFLRCSAIPLDTHPGSPHPLPQHQPSLQRRGLCNLSPHPGISPVSYASKCLLDACTWMPQDNLITTEKSAIIFISLSCLHLPRKKLQTSPYSF